MLIVKTEHVEEVKQLIAQSIGRLDTIEVVDSPKDRDETVIHFDFSSDEDTIIEVLQSKDIPHKYRF